MPRQVVVPRLGVGGRNTEKPTWALNLDEVADGSTDGVIHDGALKSRRGVTATSRTAPGSVAHAVARVQHVKANRTVTYTFTKDAVYAETPGTFGSASTNGIVMLPRAVYRDESLWCAQNGLSPMLRVRGAGLPSSSGAASTVANRSIVTFATALNATDGSFLSFQDATTTQCRMDFRVENDTGLSTALESFVSSTVLAPTCSLSFFGYTFPCIPVYEAGTVSVAASVATGVGTLWKGDPAAAAVGTDGGIMILSAGIYRAGQFISTSDTAANVSSPNVTDAQYSLLARCPFKDVCVHNDSLYGIGVAGYPSRVFIGPPGWDLGVPPGATLPFNVSAEFNSGASSDFTLDYIDVPSAMDGDPIIAILATDGPRIVLKSSSVWGLYGEPPTLDPRLLTNFDGCFDIQSAISTQMGAFWAGRFGVYRYLFGQITDLTDGWMQDEWRSLAGATEYCSLAVNGRLLYVSIMSSGLQPSKRRMFIYDLSTERWLPEMTNVTPRGMFSVDIPGETSQLLAVDDSYTSSILDLAPAYNDAGPARDEVGTGPTFKVVTGDGFGQALGIEGDTRAVELALHATVHDPGGTTTLDVKVVSGGSHRGQQEGQGFNYDSGVNWDTGAYWGPDGCKDVGNLDSTTHDQVVRNEYAVNRVGRRHHLEIEQTTTSATVETIEVGETILTVKDMRRGA